MALAEIARRGRGEIIDLGTKYYIFVIALDGLDGIGGVFGVIASIFDFLIAWQANVRMGEIRFIRRRRIEDNHNEGRA